MPQRWIAESGSTKTLWVNVDAPEMRWQTAGLNPSYRSAEEIREAITEEIALSSRELVDEIYFYGAGCASEKSVGVMYSALASVFGKAKKVHVEHDLLGAARGMLGKEDGLVCILGTGSHACLFQNGSITKEANNLGWALGDEGSGGWIGKQLIKAHFYGHIPGLLDEDFNRFIGHSRDEVVERIYKQPWPNRFMAGMVPFAIAHQEHPYIKEMVKHGFSLFLDTHVLPLTKQQLPISFTGGVAFSFATLLTEVIEAKGRMMGGVRDNPSEGLVRFHLELEG